MMDLGALICTAHNPRCQICPVKKLCRARDPASLPRKRRRAAIVPLTESHGLSTMAGAVLLEQCGQRWRGMWMLPKIPAPRSAPIHTARFPFTHHRVTLQVFRIKAARPASHQRWFPIRHLNKIPMPSPHRRAIEALLA
jgi:A/G-specific adenine glycosylase